MEYIIKKKNGELCHAGVKGMKWDFSKRKYHFDTSNLQAYREQLAKMYGQAKGAVGSAYRTAKPYAQTAYSTARKAAGSAYRTAKPYAQNAYNTARSAAGSAYGQAKGAVNGFVNKKRAQKNAGAAQLRGKNMTERYSGSKMYDSNSNAARKAQIRTSVANAQARGRKRHGETVDDIMRKRVAVNGKTNRNWATEGPEKTLPSARRKARKDLSKVRNQDLRRDILNGNKTSGNSTASEFHGKQRSKLNVNANGHRTKKIVGIKNQNLRKELLDSRRPQSNNSTASEFYGKKAHKLNLKSTGSHRTKKIAGIKNQKLRDELLRSKKKKSGNRTARINERF